jgi:mRNA-degrading endonuclease RelE of RelBE toxin-antitoxin system
MNAVFFETTIFSRLRPGYLDDDGYRLLQIYMLASPESGDLMPGTGGFRKLRWHDGRGGKGKRGGLRVVYYWLIDGNQIWMFSIYDKDEVSNLSADQQRQLKAAIDAELRKRGNR